MKLFDVVVLKRLLVDEGITDRPVWLKKQLTAYSRILSEDRLRYRAFGPYWWNLKKMLNDHGYPFSANIDVEVSEKTNYGSDDLNFVAAFVYEENRIETVNIYDPYPAILILKNLPNMA